MIFKMSDREEGDPSRRSKLNGLSNHDKDDGFDRDLEETLNAFLASSLLSPDAESLQGLNQVSGEYTSLNNTIDELNRYLDRWDERHDQLRAHIREAIRANEEENECEEEEEEDSENKGASNVVSTSDCARKDSEQAESKEDESAKNEEQSPNQNDRSI